MDWVAARGVADEAHIDRFVVSIGGERLDRRTRHPHRYGATDSLIGESRPKHARVEHRRLCRRVPARLGYREAEPFDHSLK